MSVRIFRVTVRGFFDQLDDESRRLLLDELDEHVPLKAAFTEDGTFTYERPLTAFSFRFQLREQGDDDEARSVSLDRASQRARALATDFLDRAGIGFKRLRVQATDMADVWS